MVDAGWYDDPNDPAQFAYWDGTAWTGQTHPKPAPEPPAPSAWGAPQTAAPSAWGAPAATPATGSWGSPAPAPAPTHRPAAAPARRGRKVPVKGFLFLLLVVAAAGAAFVLTRDDEAEPVAVADVMAALEKQGVTCADDATSLTPAEAAAVASDMPAHFATESGSMTQRQSANLISSATEVSKMALELPEGASYALPQCGNSWVLHDAETAYVVVLGPNAEEAKADLEELGVPVRDL